jgi:hypothetical protein
VRNLVISSFLICLASGCRHNNGKELENYLSGEITHRLNILAQTPVKDSVREIAQEIDVRIKELILLSKDIENKQAPVNLSAMYFSSLAPRLKMPENEFIPVSATMNMKETSTALLQNELTALNRLSFMNNVSDITPGAAR